MPAIELTLAAPGSGKSWSRTKWVVDEFLPHAKGVLYTNLPLNLDKIAEAMKAKKVDPQEVSDRIVLIPKEILDDWKNGGNPKDYFVDLKIVGARLELYEASSFTGGSMDAKRAAVWDEFCKEIRHRKCSINFIAQNEMQLPKKIRDLATIKRELYNSEDRRDFLFNIPMYDWYQLKSKFITRSWKPTIFETEFTNYNRTWKPIKTQRFQLGQPYYDYYNSYNAPVGEEGEFDELLEQEVESVKLEWERLKAPALAFWFFRRNWFGIISRGLIVTLILWVFLGGGIRWGVDAMQSQFKKAVKDPDKEQVEEEQTPAAKRIQKMEGKLDDLSNLTTDTIGDDAVEIYKMAQTLVAEYEDLAVKYDEQQEKLSVLNRLTAITKNYIILRSGHRYNIGETIDYGQYEGYQVASINTDKRLVFLLKEKEVIRLWLLGSE